MKMSKLTENIIITVIAILCILISIADFLGLLDSVPFISNRIGIMNLLTIGALALYIISHNHRSFELIKEGHKEIISNMDIKNPEDREMLNKLHGIWSERDSLIQQFFKKAIKESKKKDFNSFIDFLKVSEAGLDRGDILNTKMRFPYDINIVAIDLEGRRKYHILEELINTRPSNHHPNNDILKKKNGVVYWNNQVKGKFLYNFKLDFPSNLRFTKMYFREIPIFKLILIIQSNINIFPNLIKMGKKN